MMDRPDKRRYERLRAVFGISCRKIGSRMAHVREGQTVNVSPGGLYFHTAADSFKRGDLLKIELLIPPKPGQLEFGGKMEGVAKVLRAENITDYSTGEASPGSGYGVALQFCRPPKFCA
ncbi:MAG: hypothetical protein A2Z25_17000 [Planctomycetes bacterium RBG_16_55_9]|nr:MAG: hypothetical protein A2Z25_17000 [Planctomycetes bacterium RBG_16_55_9]